ncbi:MAG: class I SAM-dependent methyltransferase [Clostridiales bacterium]|nr:class I SAM-dependent methyltransferase [Clostridiales bacterium]
MDDSFYDILAEHYDDLQLTGDTEAWGPYILGLITDFCKAEGKTVTDLGCGTGVITNFLASKGFEVTGVDLSPDMLAIASSGDETGTVSWICADITSYEGPTCGCFISTMDTIGHITDKDSLAKMFASVAGLLEDGGIFILDATTKHHFEDTLGENVFYEDYDDFTLLWVNHYDKETKINHAELTLFELCEDDLYERYDGELTARCYSSEEIEEMAKRAGLKTYAKFGDLNREEPSGKDERIFYVFGK